MILYFFLILPFLAHWFQSQANTGEGGINSVICESLSSLLKWNIVPVNKGWRISLDIWTNKHARKNADSGQFLDFIGEKQSVHPSFPTLLYLFPADCLSAPSFYGSPSLCLYGAIGKYTTSRLIISQPGWRGAISSVWSSLQRLKNSTNAAGKQSSLWPSHSSDALRVTALRHITCLALVLEVPDSSCGGVLRVCVWGEEGVWMWGQLLGHWHLHHIASIRTPFPWLIEWNSRTLWSRSISECLLDFRFIG